MGQDFDPPDFNPPDGRAREGRDDFSRGRERRRRRARAKVRSRARGGMVGSRRQRRPGGRINQGRDDSWCQQRPPPPPRQRRRRRKDPSSIYSSSSTPSAPSSQFEEKYAEFKRIIGPPRQSPSGPLSLPSGVVAAVGVGVGVVSYHPPSFPLRRFGTRPCTRCNPWGRRTTTNPPRRSRDRTTGAGRRSTLPPRGDPRRTVTATTATMAEAEAEAEARQTRGRGGRRIAAGREYVSEQLRTAPFSHTKTQHPPVRVPSPSAGRSSSKQTS